MMYQGWLFAEEVKEEGRLGVARWPLIGFFDPYNLKAGVSAIIVFWIFSHRYRQDESDVASIGINTLKAADQHTHLVQVCHLLRIMFQDLTFSDKGNLGLGRLCL